MSFLLLHSYRGYHSFSLLGGEGSQLTADFVLIGCFAMHCTNFGWVGVG